jgi:signal transduction histidine kinase
VSKEYVFDPYILDKNFEKKLDDAYQHFDDGNSDSAAKEILHIYQLETNPYHLYLIHCYQSEILYYNNLPDQGFIISQMILDYANNLNDSLLKASAYNFFGLHSINKKNYAIALRFFNKAKSWYPKGKSYPKQVDYYQIMSNLAETHLNLNNIDSTFYYVEESNKSILEKKNNRGITINLWTLGIANLKFQKYTEAEKYLIQAMQYVDTKKNPDMYHHILAGLIKLYAVQSQFQKSEDFIEKGLNDELMKYSNFLGKAEFLGSAIDSYLKAERFKEASKLQTLLLSLERNFRNSEQRTNADLLANFYESFNELEFEKRTKLNREKELTLNRAFAISVMVLLVLTGIIFFFAIKQSKVKNHLSKLEYQNKMKLIEKQKEMDVFKARNNAINQERNRIARELHDDIGSAISSIQIYLTMALDKFSTDTEEAKKLLAKANKDAKEISENVSDLVWAIYSKNDNFENLMIKMKQFAFDVFSASEIEIEFDYPYMLKELKLGLDERRNIYLIFKEIVNNAVKHSQCTLFKVIIKENTEGLIEFILSDNGIGINENEFSQGNGMQTLQARARSLNCKLNIESNPNEGTTFSFCFKPFSEPIT